MKFYIRYAALVAVSMFIMLLAGCKEEKDDFIDGPTATSVTLSGRVCADDGTVFANIPLSLDFHSGALLSSTTIHKAKGVTDRDGRFTMYFEPESISADMVAYYLLTADLKALSGGDYILPSDMLGGDSDELWPVHIYDVSPSEKIEYDICVLSSRWITVTLEDYSPGVTLIVSNFIRKDDYQFTVSYNNVTTSANGDATVAVKGAPGAYNLLQVSDADHHQLSSVEMDVDADNDNSVTVSWKSQE